MAGSKGTRNGSGGRFQKGNAGGPGRPRRETERAYLDATISGCSVAQWTLIVKRAVADAKKGNACARRWLSDILLGRDPVAMRQAVDEMRDQLEELLNGSS